MYLNLYEPLNRVPFLRNWAIGGLLMGTDMYMYTVFKCIFIYIYLHLSISYTYTVYWYIYIYLFENIYWCLYLCVYVCVSLCILGKASEKISNMLTCNMCPPPKKKISTPFCRFWPRQRHWSCTTTWFELVPHVLVNWKWSITTIPLEICRGSLKKIGLGLQKEFPLTCLIFGV